jgi:hypothetical protein
VVSVSPAIGPATTRCPICGTVADYAPCIYVANTYECRADKPHRFALVVKRPPPVETRPATGSPPRPPPPPRRR